MSEGDISALLRELSSGLAKLSGKIDTLDARLDGRLNAQAAEQSRLRRELATLREHDVPELRIEVEHLKTWRNRLIGIAIGSGALGFFGEGALRMVFGV